MLRDSAIPPNTVSSPTATTTATAEPPTTLVPMKAMLSHERTFPWQSTGVLCLLTGLDSPVNAD